MRSALCDYYEVTVSKLFEVNGLAGLDELYFPDDAISWPSPWWCLESNLKVRTGIQVELNAEIGPQHPLWGLKPVVIGKCDANDDIVVHLVDGRYACVHLVWHGKIDQYPSNCPSTLIFESAADLQSFFDRGR